MLEKIHIVGLGLMGTNLGIKLVNSGIKVSGSDISEKNVGRAKELGALSLDHEESIDYVVQLLEVSPKVGSGNGPLVHCIKLT